MRFILAAATCGFNPALASGMAKKYGFTGIELMPLRWHRINKQKHGIRATAVHAPFWGQIGYDYWRRSGDRREKLLAFVFGWGLMGLVEDNPAIPMARILDVPLNLHPGVVFEMRELDLLHRLTGLKLRIENDDANYHPLTPDHTNGIYAAVQAHEMLADYGIDAGYTLDLAHLAVEKKWRGDKNQYLSHLNEAMDLFGPYLEAVHLVDYKYADHRGIKPGEVALGLGSLPLDHIKRQLLRTERLLGREVDVTLEVAPNMAAGAALVATGGRIGRGEVEYNIHTSMRMWRRA